MSVQPQDEARLWVEKVVGHQIGGELTKLEAEQVTAKIKAYAKVAWLLLYEAHKRQAHKAMGYATWAEYVEAEFDMSRSRSYQLISQARVVYEISEVVSTSVDISEPTARVLAPHLDEAKAAAQAAVAALDDAATEADRADAAERAMNDLRDSKVDTAPPNVNPETGEIEEEPTRTGTPDEAGGSAPPPAADPPASPTEAGLANLTEKVNNSDIGYRAQWSKQRSIVRSGLLTLDPERCAAVTDPDDRSSCEAFVRDVRSWLDRHEAALIDSTRLKAVK